MRVKVEVEGEVLARDGVLVKVQRKCVKGEPGGGWSKHAHWVPLSACTPILPDFREGDLVEHVPSGARGTAKNFLSSNSCISNDKKLRVLIPHFDGSYQSTNWCPNNCRIIRKAGEEK